ncbi:3' terminal RNA ribose 2'-O-methyltransferase Hen1 [Clostridia bacterium]|nr:3' terminal RNA ribose 2'-O-methyltransferase Hen1 [Clostridia bacterium]
MLLKITYMGENTTDLGYLLHKNPNRTQSFELSFGKAYVFYPEATAERTTAALLLDINPIDLARGKLGSRDGGLFDYVNDRPYVSSSFMSTAISKVFSTALSGKCDNKPELAEQKLDLEAEVVMLPCLGNKDLIGRIFTPLGYEVEFSESALDEKFREWGESRYVTLKLKGKVRLCDLLNHLYVLIPVFDNRKHYWVSDDEVEKLIGHGEGWLNAHPEKELIAARYLNRNRSLVNSALAQLIEKGNGIAEEADSAETGEVTPPAEKDAPKIRLNDLRLQAVADAVIAGGAKAVIDIGCGEGRLIARLINHKQIARITGVDVSIRTLERAKSYLHYERLSEKTKEKLQFLQGSLTYKDKRFAGYDAACVVEVVEHLDQPRLPAFERVLFELAAPPLVVMTTPNAEYNVNYERLQPESLRHSDHRFEWTREQFQEWANGVCKRFGYAAEFSDIGERDEQYGAPTQMCVFKRT